MLVEVLPARNNMFPLTYQSDQDLHIGDVVIVPFRNKEILAIISNIVEQTELKNIKNVVKRLDFKVSSQTLEYYKKAADYYLSEIGSIIKIALPVDFHKVKSQQKEVLDEDILQNMKLPLLSDHQQEALNNIRYNGKNVTLLRGVTGSGKTEVYFHLIYEVVKSGKQALILIPEIALTTQIIQRFIDRFGFEPIIWNSSITPSKKKKYFGDIITNKSKLIIGTRSALFLPYPNLGLVVVDEEHDGSYKQENLPSYNARDMAVMRGYFEEFPLLLCSATPSIETLHNIRSDKYKIVELNSRFGEANLPDISIIDMFKEKLGKDRYLSDKLVSAMKVALKQNSQILLFLNRRGYSPLMLCRSCGHRYICKECSSWMTYHKNKKRLECHHCMALAAVKKNCPQCEAEDSHIPLGPGVERIYEEVSKIMPDARLQLMTKENMRTNQEVTDLVANIIEKRVDIIIGTQIVTKGYHFPNLNFVGVVDADIGILGEDLRSSERTLQLLQQVSGRAGRETKGEVYIQTYVPNNAAVKAIANMDIDNFISYELEHRKEHNMPPFSRMAMILISGKKETEILRYVVHLSKLAPKSEEVSILGPSAAVMSKLQGRYRFRFIIYAKKEFPLQKYIKSWFEDIKIPSKFSVKIDIDPYNLV